MVEAYQIESTRVYKPEKFPNARFVIRKPTVALRSKLVARLRQEASEAQKQPNPDAVIALSARIMWQELVVSSNIEILDESGQNREIPHAELFDHLGDELSDAIATELQRCLAPTVKTDDNDAAIIEICEKQIAEARARIEKRKNSGPQSSTATETAPGETAASATPNASAPTLLDLMGQAGTASSSTDAPSNS